MMGSGKVDRVPKHPTLVRRLDLDRKGTEGTEEAYCLGLWYASSALSYEEDVSDLKKPDRWDDTRAPRQRHKNIVSEG